MNHASHNHQVEKQENIPVSPEINDHTQHGEIDHSMHDMADHSAHTMLQGHAMPATPAEAKMTEMDHSAHAGHGTDHTGHEQMFRTRFWWCLLLSIPVLLYSGMIQMWLGFTPPAFPYSGWIPFVFSVIIFAYGGLPFLQMAVPELRERKPGMMRSFRWRFQSH